MIALRTKHPALTCFHLHGSLLYAHGARANGHIKLGETQTTLAERLQAEGSQRIDVDAGQQQILASLSYYVASPPSNRVIGSFDTLALVGPDPDDLLKDVDRSGVAHGLLETNQSQQALEIFQGLLERFPNSAPAFDGHLKALVTLGRIADAEAALVTALKRWPDRRDHHDKLL